MDKKKIGVIVPPEKAYKYKEELDNAGYTYDCNIVSDDVMTIVIHIDSEEKDTPIIEQIMKRVGKFFGEKIYGKIKNKNKND